MWGLIFSKYMNKLISLSSIYHTFFLKATEGFPSTLTCVDILLGFSLQIRNIASLFYNLKRKKSYRRKTYVSLSLMVFKKHLIVSLLGHIFCTIILKQHFCCNYYARTLLKFSFHHRETWNLQFELGSIHDHGKSI